MIIEAAACMQVYGRAKRLKEIEDSQLPPLHPNCRCYGTPLLQPVKEWLDAHKARGSHGHGLGPIRRFKGL